MPAYRIAIVGAGPAGYFAAQALQNRQSAEVSFAIDMFEKLPTPWGLVRSGVAPDHPKIKSVSKVFEKISNEPNIRLVANVDVGQDISLSALQSVYDAVILATGTQLGRNLRIPGEGLLNCWSSAQFVSWYNGHPEYSGLDVDLSGRRAIIIGAGNVALDIARLFAKSYGDLITTDISDRALGVIKSSNVTEVWICARRPAAFASFTAMEIRELAELKDVDILVYPNEVMQAMDDVGPAADRNSMAKLDALKKIAGKEGSAIGKRIVFHFGITPKKILGREKVESILFSTPQGEIKVEADVVITAIGYKVNNTWGLRVENDQLWNTDGHISDNLYVVGWARRGSSGVIGTNKRDAEEVVRKVVAHLSALQPKDNTLANNLLENLDYVDSYEWSQIDDYEKKEGARQGRPRVKLTTKDELLGIAKIPKDC